MNDPGGNFADETAEMVSESVTSPSTELRKRRSTRIVQAVPLVVTGVDALGRPFVERTSSLIINCHGCRYQSKHYVLKNMWVTMEIPHPETGQPPRTVRGRVAWIQRPRTVRQLFQVALELEASGNVWGIGFPPEDWTAFPEPGQFVMKLDGAPESSPLPPQADEQEADEHSRTAHAAAAEAVRTELPRWLAPQLEQLTRDLTESLSREGATQRGEHAQRLETSSEALGTACQKAEETAARLNAQTEQLEATIVARVESATQALEETAKRTEETASTQREALLAAAQEIQQQVTAALASTQSSLHGQLASELEAAQTRWQAAIESTLAEAQDRAAGGLNEHARGWMDQLQDEIARHAKAARESASNAAIEAEQRLTALRDSLQEQTQRLEAVLEVAPQHGKRSEPKFPATQYAQQPALADFQSNLENQLTPHREELHRRSEAIAEELNSKIRATFDEASRQAVSQFEQQIKEVVQPQVTSAV